MAELVIDPLHSAIIRVKFHDLMRKRDLQVRELDLFQDMILPNARKLREVINSGERGFGEFLTLLDDASRYKKFLAAQNPDKRLLEAFHAEVTKQSWLDRLPSKTIRFGITSGLGLAADALFPTGGVGTLMGLGIGGADALLLDRLMKGWRPNQFINDTLLPFVSGQTS
jgi:hypothetical protein